MTTEDLRSKAHYWRPHLPAVSEVLEQAAAELEALQGEVATLSQNLECTGRVVLARDSTIATLRTQNEALQKEVKEAHAILDDPECLIIRNEKDGYPDGRPDRMLTLVERVKALLRMKIDYKKWMQNAEQERDSLRAQNQTLREALTCFVLSAQEHDTNRHSMCHYGFGGSLEKAKQALAPSQEGRL